MDVDGASGMHRRRRAAAQLEREDEFAPRVLPRYSYTKSKTADIAAQEAGERQRERERDRAKRNKKKRGGLDRVKSEDGGAGSRSHSGSAEGTPDPGAETPTVDAANALQLSDSDDEELMDNLVSCFLPHGSHSTSSDEDDEDSADGMDVDDRVTAANRLGSKSRRKSKQKSGRADGLPNSGKDLEERIYLFQFPAPFPSFKHSPQALAAAAAAAEAAAAEGSAVKKEDTGSESESGARSKGKGILKSRPSKGVSFAPDTTGGGGAAGVTPSPRATPQPRVKKEDEDERGGSSSSRKGSGSSSGKRSKPPPEGRIGSLIVKRDGSVAFHLGSDQAARKARRAQRTGTTPAPPSAGAEGESGRKRTAEDSFLLLDVTGGSKATFLQQLVVMDTAHATATCLGEIDSKFVVTPDLDLVLSDLNLKSL